MRKNEFPRTGYRHSKTPEDLKEKDILENKKQEKDAEDISINNYSKYFSSNPVLKYFPFDAFSREEKLLFISRIQNHGTASILSAASNVFKSDNTHGFVVEWNEERLNKLMYIVLGTEYSEAKLALIKKASESFSIATNGFINFVQNYCCISFPQKLPQKRINSDVCNYLKNVSRIFFKYPQELYPDILLFYIRYVESCLLSMHLSYSAYIRHRLGDYPIPKDFPSVAKTICENILRNCDAKTPEDISKLHITSAFHHYAIFMKYFQTFIMNENIQEEILEKLPKEISQWDHRKLKIACHTEDLAIRLGLNAVGIKMSDSNKEKILNFYKNLEADHAYFHDRHISTTWALLGYICFKCNLNKLPVLVTRNTKDMRHNKDEGHSKGREPHSIKKFANGLGALKPGEQIKNDARIFYIKQISDLGTLFINGVLNEIIDDVINPMAVIRDYLANLFLCYDPKKAVETATNILLETWDYFYNNKPHSKTQMT